mmetsp:Transcript_6062/g.13096  ORF Transcript_6062/g.13096 Transcript_6062/m.13096 type:complete len:280 (-) Transcript_6062:751-1590(-)
MLLPSPARIQRTAQHSPGWTPSPPQNRTRDASGHGMPQRWPAKQEAPVPTSQLLCDVYKGQHTAESTLGAPVAAVVATKTTDGARTNRCQSCGMKPQHLHLGRRHQRNTSASHHLPLPSVRRGPCRLGPCSYSTSLHCGRVHGHRRGCRHSPSRPGQIPNRSSCCTRHLRHTLGRPHDPGPRSTRATCRRTTPWSGRPRVLRGACHRPSPRRTGRPRALRRACPHAGRGRLRDHSCAPRLGRMCGRHHGQTHLGSRFLGTRAHCIRQSKFRWFRQSKFR